ncbi:hypothetical protein FB451DRAFT_1186885 [Mycena latifolia]|nr:hypothetical protein FB451DRAFT_1186885 [Mycena latifolia]
MALTQNGAVLGTCPPHAPDDGYRACSVAFYPSAQYQGPADDEPHTSTTYHFLENTDCPAIFSDATYTTPTSTAARTGAIGVEDPVMTMHLSVADVSHAVFTWCRRVHNHPITPARRTSKRKRGERQVPDILTWQAFPTLAHSQGDAPKSKRAPKPPARPSRAITLKRLNPPSTISRSRVKALLPLVPALSRPAVPLEASALPPDIKTPPSASTAPATSGVTAWFVLEDGQVSDDAAEAEAFVKLKGVSKIKIVPSLDDARAWYLGRTAVL